MLAFKTYYGMPPTEVDQGPVDDAVHSKVGLQVRGRQAMAMCREIARKVC